jgi:hypothetical protein
LMTSRITFTICAACIVLDVISGLDLVNLGDKRTTL